MKRQPQCRWLSFRLVNLGRHAWNGKLALTRHFRDRITTGGRSMAAACVAGHCSLAKFRAAPLLRARPLPFFIRCVQECLDDPWIE